jgi:hypothetical protein
VIEWEEVGRYVGVGYNVVQIEQVYLCTSLPCTAISNSLCSSRSAQLTK